MTLAVETGRSVNPGAISQLRFLITRRIEDLDGAVGRLETRQKEASDRAAHLGHQLEAAERAWGKGLRELSRVSPEAADTQHRLVTSTRADLAAL